MSTNKLLRTPGTSSWKKDFNDCSQYLIGNSEFPSKNGCLNSTTFTALWYLSSIKLPHFSFWSSEHQRLDPPRILPNTAIFVKLICIIIHHHHLHHFVKAFRKSRYLSMLNLNGPMSLKASLTAHTSFSKSSNTAEVISSTKWLRQRKWLHPRKCLRLVVESLGEFSQRHSSWGFERGVYHTSHFLTGFILDPRGQLKTWENSARLVRGPTTRKLAGEWASFSRRSLVASSVLVEHQTWGTKYEWIYVCKLLRQGNRKQWIPWRSDFEPTRSKL